MEEILEEIKRVTLESGMTQLKTEAGIEKEVDKKLSELNDKIEELEDEYHKLKYDLGSLIDYCKKL